MKTTSSLRRSELSVQRSALNSSLLPKIARVLRSHKGAENAIPVRDLTRLIGLPVTLERSVRRLVKLNLAVLWNDHKLPILSNARGYFVGDDIEQFQRACDIATAIGLQHIAFASAIHRLCGANGLRLEPPPLSK